jgi:glycosyltransferase involved in cell wall biosynthesis
MVCDIVLFAPSPVGGLAEHTHYQAEALHKAGVSVTVLTCPGYLAGRKTSYPAAEIFPSPSSTPGFIPKLLRMWSLIRRFKLLNRWITRHPCRILLLESYVEYFSPLWVGHLAAIRKRGVMIGANLHDPVRDYRIGPRWWHDWTVRLAYRDLSFGLCHQNLPKGAVVPGHLRIHTVPVGVYKSPPADSDQRSAREALGLPPDKRIILSFGFIRDNKNLDLFIRAMPSAGNVYLVVAGRHQSAKDRPVSHYMKIASECKVDMRTRFDSDFIPDEMIPLYFAACDVVLLTYGSNFHSQSGVLNVAACYRKPVLASSGESPLRDAVRNFHLGHFVDPDCVAALRDALAAPLDPAACDWDGYFRYASWQTNIEPVIHLLNHLKNQDDEKV